MITGIVVDKNGHKLTDEALKNKTIKISGYYDLVTPIRERINKDFFDKRKKQ